MAGVAGTLVLALVPGTAGAALKEVTVATPAPYGIASGVDGAIWFTGPQTSMIGKVTAAGVPSSFPLTPSATVPWAIAAGADGAMWFTQPIGVTIGRAVPGGTTTNISVPVGSVPAGIALGPDNAIWYANSSGKIGRMDGMTPKETRVPTFASGPVSLTSGPDGAIWFTDLGADRIGRVTTSFAFSSYAIPSSSRIAPAVPWGITSGPDGALWFTEQDANKVARISTDGAVKEFALPTAGALPRGITTGPDGALWIAEFGADQIARMTTDGRVMEFPLADGSNPESIVAGPDKGLWFTEVGAGKIGRLDATDRPASRGPSVSCSSSQPFGPAQLSLACTVFHVADGRRVTVKLTRGRRTYATARALIEQRGLGVLFKARKALPNGSYSAAIRVSSKLTLRVPVVIA